MAKFEEMYTSMSPNEKFYFEDRLDDQINWYDVKSISSQKKYKSMKSIVILSSALITFFIAFSSTQTIIKIIIGLLSVTITFFEGLLNINKYQEHWIEYRSICETLRHEKFMYLYNSGVYSDRDRRFEFFVERIESIVSKENLNWANLNKNESGEKNSG